MIALGHRVVPITGDVQVEPNVLGEFKHLRKTGMSPLRFFWGWEPNSLFNLPLAADLGASLLFLFGTVFKELSSAHWKPSATPKM